MLKKDWKKNLLRVKQIADQNLGRAEKTEVLSEDLVLLEKRVDLIKQVFQNTSKKLGSCIQGQGTDVEKRLKKIPEYGLSHSMIESAMLLGDNTLMGVLFQLAGEAEGSMAREWLQYEMEVENKVLTPLHGLLENEIPAIAKLRKSLAKMTLDMDSARGRYMNAARQTQSSGSMSLNKVDTLKDELEDASTRVEQCRDHLCTEMYSFLSKEADYSALLSDFIEEQSKYHRNALDILEKLKPQMNSQMEQCIQMPVFGCDLEDHLRRTNRDIASVIEDSVCTLLEIGMDEEGLFRIAGGASRVKKLKAAFDAGAADMSEYVRDVPCIAGCLKLYLRELPEPLMTFHLYNEWMHAAHLPADQRLQALWVVMDKLPKPNYDNLRYLIKFLSKLAEYQDLNKMSPSNIAIVIGPNLIWPPGENGPSVLTTSTQSAIVESFITHADWFFPGDIDFHKTSRDSSSISSEHCKNESVGKVKKQKASMNRAFGMMHHTLLAPITHPTSGNNASQISSENVNKNLSSKTKTNKKRKLHGEKTTASSDEDSMSSQGTIRHFLKKHLNSSGPNPGHEEKDAEDSQVVNTPPLPPPPPPYVTMTRIPKSSSSSSLSSLPQDAAKPADNCKNNNLVRDVDRAILERTVEESDLVVPECVSQQEAVTSKSIPDLISDTVALADTSAITPGDAQDNQQSTSSVSLSSSIAGLPLQPPPAKSFHTDVYNTAFALHSLRSDSCSDYLTQVRTLMDGHMNKRLSASSPGSYQHNGNNGNCGSSGKMTSVEDDQDIDFNPSGSMSTPTYGGITTPPIGQPFAPSVAVDYTTSSPVTALCAATLPVTAASNSQNTMAVTDSMASLSSSPKFTRKLSKKPAPLPPQLPPPPAIPYGHQHQGATPDSTSHAPDPNTPSSDAAMPQVTISSPILISSSAVEPSSGQSHHYPQPNSPRPDRPRGPPPERPMGPPPDRPHDGHNPTVAEKPDKPARPQLPPTVLAEPSINRNDRKGSGRPARPTPPPPPPPHEKRDSVGRDEVDGDLPPTPPMRRESQKSGPASVIVEETHL